MHKFRRGLGETEKNTNGTHCWRHATSAKCYLANSSSKVLRLLRSCMKVFKKHFQQHETLPAALKPPVSNPMISRDPCNVCATCPKRNWFHVLWDVHTTFCTSCTVSLELCEDKCQVSFAQFCTCRARSSSIEYGTPARKQLRKRGPCTQVSCKTSIKNGRRHDRNECGSIVWGTKSRASRNKKLR